MTNSLWDSTKQELESSPNSQLLQRHQLLDIAVPVPIDFMRTVVGFRNTIGEVETATFFIAPNLSFDFYQIQPFEYKDLEDRQLKPLEVETGFFSIDHSNKIRMVSKHDERPNENLIGVWVSNLPDMDNMKDPYVWSACARLVMCEEQLQNKIKSPSSDKNTFVVGVVQSDSPSDMKMYEFKIVQNQQKSKGPRNYNSWIVIHSTKNMDIEDNQVSDDLVKKPSILKSNDDGANSYKIYKYSRLLKEYDFSTTNRRRSTSRASTKDRKSSAKRTKPTSGVRVTPCNIINQRKKSTANSYASSRLEEFRQSTLTHRESDVLSPTGQDSPKPLLSNRERRNQQLISKLS